MIKPLLRVLPVAIVLLLAGCGSGQASKPLAPVTVQLELSRTTVTAGTPIKGVAIFTNTTAHSITVKDYGCGLKDDFRVGLASPQVPFERAPFYTPVCKPADSLAPGTSNYKITIATNYGGCDPPLISDPGGNGIACTPHGPPPLPVGRYRTEIDLVGLPKTTQLPPPITVTLMAPAS